MIENRNRMARLTAKKSPGNNEANLFWNSLRPSSTAWGRPLTQAEPLLWSTSKLMPLAMVCGGDVRIDSDEDGTKIGTLEARNLELRRRNKDAFA